MNLLNIKRQTMQRKKTTTANTHYVHYWLTYILVVLLPHSLCPLADGQRMLPQMEHPGYRVYQMHIICSLCSILIKQKSKFKRLTNSKNTKYENKKNSFCSCNGRWTIFLL